MVQKDWVRVDGECYATKEHKQLIIFNGDGKEINIEGNVSLVINQVDDKYRLSRNCRVKVLSEELYSSMALAKISMIKYMAKNNF